MSKFKVVSGSGLYAIHRLVMKHPCAKYSKLMSKKKNGGTMYKIELYSKAKENKRPMGHIAHLRKQFKSINTYDYIITLIKRRKKPPLLTS